MKYIILFFVFFSLLSCKNELPQEWSDLSNKYPNARKEADSIELKRLDSLLIYIEIIQNEILLSTNKDSKLLKKYVNKTFDTLNNCFYSVGKGVKNPAYPPEAQELSRVNASKYNGEQWALYFKAVSIGKKVSLEKSIPGHIFYSNVIYKKLVNDTLFSLIETPLGSINLAETSENILPHTLSTAINP